MTARAAALLLGLAACTAWAQGRPDEEALFGAPPDAGTPAAAAPAPLIPSAGPAPDRNSAAGEQQILTGAPAQDAFAAGLVKEDALKIGGQFYIRALTTISQDQPFGKSNFNVPTLLDVYLDARPTDRLRAFVLGRLQYDPFLSNNTFLTGVSLSGLTQVSNPAVYLDQAWLAFDIARTAFVTAGVQHVKWGTGRYFNPDDFLASQPRNPLAIFDARLGVSMLRVQVPWEKVGLNFTAVAVFQATQNISTTGTTVSGSGGNSVNLVNSSQNNPTGFLENIGGAGQVEYDFKGGAVGINALAQKYRAWRVGAYTTAGLGDFDVYGEAVLKQCLDLPYGAPNSTCSPSYPNGIVVPGTYGGYTFGTIQQPPSPVFQAVAGLTYSINVEGNKSITLGAEYFFNSGSFGSQQYPNLIFQGAYQPFYLGRNYLAISATLLDTTAKTTWVLTTIGNLSDVSAITRLDFIVTVLSYLQVEAFAAVDYGHLGGEFRLGLDIPGVKFNTGQPAPNNTLTTDVVVHAPIVQLGVGLRMAL